MSTLNLGLQTVGLERHAGDDRFETEASNCNSLGDLRKAAVKRPDFREEALDSIAPVKALLSGVFRRLKLKEKPIDTSTSSQGADIEALWNGLSSISSNPVPSPELLRRKSDLKKAPSISSFFEHCTRQRHYFFEIRKCGDEACGICKPLRLPRDVFEKIKPFPDPIPGTDGHYLSFAEVYGSDTSEEHRPSAKKSKQRTLPFHGKLQHVKNANLMIICEECGLWRLVYAIRELEPAYFTRKGSDKNVVLMWCTIERHRYGT
jgi:hypothetical protein